MAKKNGINRVGKAKDIYFFIHVPPGQNGPILVDGIFRRFVAPGRSRLIAAWLERGGVYDSWQRASSYTVHA